MSTVNIGRHLWLPEVFAFSVALMWSVGIVMVALFYDEPMSSHTVVEANGPQVLVLFLVPVVVTAAMCWSFWNQPRQQGAGPLAWMLIGLLGLVMFIGMLTVGPLMVPTFAALLVAGLVRDARRGRS